MASPCGWAGRAGRPPDVRWGLFLIDPGGAPGGTRTHDLQVRNPGRVVVGRPPEPLRDPSPYRPEASPSPPVPSGRLPSFRGCDRECDREVARRSARRLSNTRAIVAGHGRPQGTGHHRPPPDGCRAIRWRWRPHARAGAVGLQITGCKRGPQGSMPHVAPQLPWSPGGSGLYQRSHRRRVDAAGGLRPGPRD